MKIKAIAVGLTGFLGVFALLAQPAFAVTLTTVRPADVKPVAEAISGAPGWYRETQGVGTVELTSTMVYNQTGSAEFKTTTGADGAELALYNELPSSKLGDLASMSYATYQPTSDVQAVALQVGADFDTADSNTSWQGRLVYEPYLNKDFYGNNLAGNTWQTWLTLKDEAVWWATWSAGATTLYGQPNPCPQADPCTLSELKTAFPNVGFNAGFGNPLILKAGSGWESRTVFADGVNVNDDIWDFEPALPPAPTKPLNKDECKKDGWKTFTANYKNQGQCVAAVVSSDNSKHNR